MLAYALRRLLQAAGTLAVLLVLVFLVLRLAPGGPAYAFLGPDRYTPSLAARIDEQLGLDRPLPEQAVRWVTQLTRGELGYSYFHHRPAVSVVWERFPATLALGGSAFLLALGLGVPAGVWAAVHHDGLVDRVLSRTAVVLLAIPSFWLGIGLILVCSAWLRLVPSAGVAPLGGTATVAERLRYLLLPLATLAASHVASLALYTRAAMLEALAADHTRTAHAMGLSPARVVWRHALAAAAIPIATIAGLTLAHFLEGSLVVETVFAWPGVGQLTVASVARRDYPVLLVVTCFVGTVVLLANLLTDVTARWLDPRVEQT
jgi:peptide/nickel transport system permease protein